MFDNILTSKLPTAIEIGCGFFHVNSGFKTMLEIERVLYSDMDNNLKAATAIALFYPIGENTNAAFPADFAEAIQALFDFKAQKGKRNYKPMQTNEPISLDFALDADAIFADFWREYRIDLSTTDLHWYVFLALFRNLSGEASINEIRRIRSTPVNKVPKDRQSKHLQAQEMYAIDANHDPIEEFNRKLMEECEKTKDYARYNREKKQSLAKGMKNM